MQVLQLMSALVVAAMASSSSPGSKRSSTPPSSTEVKVEVVERDHGKSSRFGFVVPVDGAVEAWVARGDKPRHCEIEVGQARAKLALKLRCGGGKQQALRIEAKRALVPGQRTRLAEVTRAAGASSEVFVTLR